MSQMPCWRKILHKMRSTFRQRWRTLHHLLSSIQRHSYNNRRPSLIYSPVQTMKNSFSSFLFVENVRLRWTNWWETSFGETFQTGGTNNMLCTTMSFVFLKYPVCLSSATSTGLLHTVAATQSSPRTRNEWTVMIHARDSKCLLIKQKVTTYLHSSFLIRTFWKLVTHHTIN